jgi:hypothetical protein
VWVQRLEAWAAEGGYPGGSWILRGPRGKAPTVHGSGVEL